jgi:hypothetical protein
MYWLPYFSQLDNDMERGRKTPVNGFCIIQIFSGSFFLITESIFVRFSETFLKIICSVISLLYNVIIVWKC